MIAAAGATCGAPKRGWNGWSKPSRPRQGRAKPAMPRERAKSSPGRGASWRREEHARPKSEKRILRKACSGALRRSEFVSRASSMSSTCSGAAACDRRQFSVPAAGRPRRGHVAQLRPRAFRLSLEGASAGAPALSIQASRAGGGACRQRLFRNAPEAGLGESMPKRGKTGLVSTVSAPFLRPLFRIGKLRLRVRAVTGSSMQGEPADRAVGKPEMSRNGHTVPDRRACFKRRLTMAAYWSK
jgi:hypothetical protein